MAADKTERSTVIKDLWIRDFLKLCWLRGQTAQADFLIEVIDEMLTAGWLFLPPLTAHHVSPDDDDNGKPNG